MILKADKNYNFELNKTFQCINCKSINFTFNVFDEEDGINIDEAIIYNTSKNKKEIALGVTCDVYNSGYSIDFKIK